MADEPKVKLEDVLEADAQHRAALDLKALAEANLEVEQAPPSEPEEAKADERPDHLYVVNVSNLSLAVPAVDEFAAHKRVVDGLAAIGNKRGPYGVSIREG